ncbi:MAG: hypothetical protein SPJ34_04845 [Candidatus Ornithospirochaeta sp.]|nr:hypothetical protein [Candidatus Ornithospirochaeta sp.]
MLRKGDGYMVVWSSEKIEGYNDVLLNSELRAYSPKSAYACMIGEKKDHSSFESFCCNAISLAPSFDKSSMELIIRGEAYIRYERMKDETQYA